MRFFKLVEIDEEEYVERTGDLDFDLYVQTNNKGNHIGDRYGFPYTIGAWCNSRLKLDPINKFIKDLIGGGYNVVEYIGIASDEPKRLERYKELETENHKYITLADLGIDELTAMDICEKNGLLSPKYKNSFRGGCWFCPKQSMWDLYQLWKDYPDYFNKLVEMEKDSFNTFRANKSILQVKQEFESGKVPKRRKKSSKFHFLIKIKKY